MFKIITFILLIMLTTSSYALEAGELSKKLPDDYVLGSENAKITLIEYASLSCPHCAEFHNNLLPTIQKEYIDAGKVRLIFRDFPLNAPALLGSQVAHCFAKQKNQAAYFAFIKTLFEQQKDWAFNENYKPKVIAMAKTKGADETKLLDCMEDKELEAKIITTRKEASEKLKVQSTPTFFANGEMVKHMHSVEDARKVFDTLLAGKSLAEEAREASAKATAIRATDIVLGKSEAKVEVVEYANIACAHCGQVHKSLLDLLKKDYIDTGKVKFAFRELPMNPNAFHAFMLAHCKGRDEYHNILNLLIEETPQWTGASAFIAPLRKVAEKAGISKEAFYACMENKDVETRISSVTNEAFEVLGIQYSPAIYVNGQLVTDLNPEAIRKVVDAVLPKE